MQVVFFILAATLVWLLALSGVVIWVVKYFRRLVNKVDQGNLVSVLEKILDGEKENLKSISEIRKHLLQLGEEGSLHVQKVGLVRFNPFQDLGGDHSFSLALLDGKDTGFVITGLHARERTRIYAKEIKKGKSEVELSKDEVRAVKLAQKNTLV